MENLADPLDRASQTLERGISTQIANIRSQGRELHPIGQCHWCEEPLGEDSKKLFCDMDCSNDYEQNKRLRG